METNDATPGRWPLHLRILLGLLIGGTAGISCRAAGLTQGPLFEALITIGDTIGQIFLRLVTMVVIPLIVSALITGVAELRDLGRLGRLGLKTLVFTLIFSGLSVLIGITVTNTLQPGTWLSDEQRTMLSEQYQADADKAVKKAETSKTLYQTLLDTIPRNPLQEMVGALDGSSPGGGLLAVMFFSLVFGAALTQLGGRAQPIMQVLETIKEAVMVIINWAMRMAPYAVTGLIFVVTARMGWQILVPLMGFVITVLLGLGIQMFVVYPIFIYQFGKMNPIEFFKRISAAIFTAFGTSSSNASLPTALRVAEEELRLPREEATFVLTIGATGNQNGTALYEGVVVLFLAQVFRVDLTLGQQLTVVLMSILAGVGTAGVPGSSLPLIVVVMESVGVPGAGIGIILGIDRVLDMSRTVLNVSGDLAIATCVASRRETTEPLVEPVAAVTDE